MKVAPHVIERLLNHKLGSIGIRTHQPIRHTPTAREALGSMGMEGPVPPPQLLYGRQPSGRVV